MPETSPEHKNPYKTRALNEEQEVPKSRLV